MTVFGTSDSPLSHILPHPWFQIPYDLGFLTQGGKITVLSDQILMMIAAGVLLVLLPILARRRRDKSEVGRLVPAGPATFIEMVCEYFRKEVAEPQLGPHTDRFIKYIWSVFFFILTMNLLGLLPLAPISAALHLRHLGGTATGNIWVTATMASLTLLMVVVNGLRLGGKAYLAHFMPGPVLLAPLMIVLEVIGLFAKTFALAMRLFANMVAGHLLLAVLVSLILMAGTSMGLGGGLGVGAVAVAGGAAIFMLEIFVAFLQAFIFTYLTALFIGMAVNVHHDDHHQEAGAH